MRKIIKKTLSDAVSSFEKLDSHLMNDVIYQSYNTIIKALRNKKKIIFCGNGGSAADSQHLAAELVGKYLKIRKAIPAISITCDTSSLTSIGNDMGFEYVFSRQIEAVA